MPKLFLVQFFAVGREKLSWNIHTADTSSENLIDLITQKNALRSSDIGIAFDTHSSGRIYAGGRPVGRFSIYPSA